MLDLSKRYRTRDGREVTDLALRDASEYLTYRIKGKIHSPIGDLIHTSDHTWTVDGRFMAARADHEGDLIEVTEEPAAEVVETAPPCEVPPSIPPFDPANVVDNSSKPLIDVTKQWITRNGNETRNIHESGDASYPLGGEVLSNGEWRTETWTRAGTVYLRGEYPNDLVTVKEEPAVAVKEEPVVAGIAGVHHQHKEGETIDISRALQTRGGHPVISIRPAISNTMYSWIGRVITTLGSYEQTWTQAGTTLHSREMHDDDLFYAPISTTAPAVDAPALDNDKITAEAIQEVLAEDKATRAAAAQEAPELMMHADPILLEPGNIFSGMGVKEPADTAEPRPADWCPECGCRAEGVTAKRHVIAGTVFIEVDGRVLRKDERGRLFDMTADPCVGGLAAAGMTTAAQNRS